MALALVAGPAWAQQLSSSSSSKDQSNQGQSRPSGPVTRTFGNEGGYRTEVRTETKGKLNQEELRQASLLMAEVFQHIDKARDALDADEARDAKKEVNKAREAIKAIRAMLPKATVHIKTTAPDGKALFEDDRDVQEGRIPLFEGMLHTQTLAPILAARRNALEVAGIHEVESEVIATEAIADLDPIEGQLSRAAKALDKDKTDDAYKALALALVRGIQFRFSKEDKELASARDAMWLARRSLEENNAAQALVNLEVARERLRLYREVLSQDEGNEVDQMLREVEQLEGQLRGESPTRTATRGERARQGNLVTSWWDKVNGWFKRHP
jgi:flagellin-specific chaperone FliS